MNKKLGTIMLIEPKELAKEFNDRSFSYMKTNIKLKSKEYLPSQKNDSCWYDVFINVPDNVLKKKEMVLAPGYSYKANFGFALLKNKNTFTIKSNTEFLTKGVFVNDCDSLSPDGYSEMIVTNAGREVVTIRNLDTIAQITLTPMYYFDFKYDEIN